MSQIAENVTNAKPIAQGAVWAGSTSMDRPTDANSSLPSEATGLGYVNEDGLTKTVERDGEDINAWGGDAVLRVQTSYAESYSFGLIETTSAVLAEAFGQENVETTDDGIKVLHRSAELPDRMFIFEIALTQGRKQRTVIPRGKVTEIEDIEYQDGEAVTYGLTLSALPDSDGNYGYTYITDGDTNGGDGGNGGDNGSDGGDESGE